MRRYIIGRVGAPTRQQRKAQPKNQKFEALYNREGLGPPPGNRASPKIRNLRPYIIGPPPGRSGKPKREGKRERKAQKSEI